VGDRRLEGPVHESDDRRKGKPAETLPAEPGSTTPDTMIVPHIGNKLASENAPWKKFTIRVTAALRIR